MRQWTGSALPRSAGKGKGPTNGNGMLSDAARRSFVTLFTRAAERHLALAAEDQVRVAPLPAGARHDPAEPEIMVLTISGFSFKLLTLFHIDTGSSALQAYFRKPALELGMNDVFPELTNLCCGSINRDLGQHFSHLGMSTPYTLHRQCLTFLDVLRPAFVERFRIDINAEVTLHATLCVVAYAPLDFTVSPFEVAETAGELEFF